MKTNEFCIIEQIIYFPKRILKLENNSNVNAIIKGIKHSITILRISSFANESQC